MKKKKKSFLCGLLTASLLLSNLACVTASAEEDQVTLENISEYVKTQNALINLQPHAKCPTLGSDAVLGLFDANNQEVFRWTNNDKDYKVTINQTNANAKNILNVTPGTDGYEFIQSDEFFKSELSLLTLDALKDQPNCVDMYNAIFYLSYKDGTSSEDYNRNLEKYNFEYNKDTKLAKFNCKYNTDDSPILVLDQLLGTGEKMTVPGNTVRMLEYGCEFACDDLSEYEKPYGLAYEDPDTNKTLYQLPFVAKSPDEEVRITDYSVDSGTYRYMNLTGSGNIYHRVTVGDKPIEYYQVKVHLADLWRYYFTNNGELLSPTELKNSHYPEDAKESYPLGYSKLSHGFIFNRIMIHSGPLIQNMIPDENGDAYLYVSKDLGTLELITQYYMKNGEDGPHSADCTGAKSYVDKNYEYNVDSPTLSNEQKGLSVLGVKPGTYTIRQITNASAKIPDTTIAVTDNYKLQEFSFGYEEPKTDKPTKPENTVPSGNVDQNTDTPSAYIATPSKGLNLKVKLVKSKKKYNAKITFNKISKATKYVIYVKKGSSKAKWKKLKTIKKSKKAAYTHKNLKKKTTYRYKVVAMKGKKKLKTSKTVKIKTKK